MLSFGLERRLLLKCHQAAYFSLCRPLSSYHQRRAPYENSAHRGNARLANQGSKNLSSEAAQGKSGYGSSLGQEGVGRTVVLDSSDNVMFNEAGGKEYLNAMTGTPLAQPENSHEDFAKVAFKQASLTLRFCSLLLIH
jgi:hypothetical protein